MPVPLRNFVALWAPSIASIDPDAAESPAEFFAVLTEVFFMQAKDLQHLYPEVYHQLGLFYRQAPLTRAT